MAFPGSRDPDTEVPSVPRRNEMRWGLVVGRPSSSPSWTQDPPPTPGIRPGRRAFGRRAMVIAAGRAGPDIWYRERDSNPHEVALA